MSNAKYYKYNNIKTPKSTKISPSSFSSLLLDAGGWYKSQIKKESTFTGNCKTVLGTCLHVRAYLYQNGLTFSDADEQNYINSFNFEGDDIAYILDNIEPMWSALFNDYLAAEPAHLLTEDEVIRDESYAPISIAGSVDAVTTHPLSSGKGINGKCFVVDFKSSERKPSEMKPEHFIQALIYAFAYKEKNIDIDTIRIVYIIAPTKTLPARTFIFEKSINEFNYNWIDHQMRIVAKKLELVKNDPSLEEVVFTPNPMSYTQDKDNCCERKDISNITFSSINDIV